MIELKNIFLTLFNLQAQVHAVTKSLNQVIDHRKYLDEIKYEGYLENRATFSGALNGILSNYTILQYCSFLEEYNNYFIPSRFENHYKERVLIVRKRNKPGLKRISEWKDLFGFRNQMVAHNFRIDKNSFFSEKLKELKYSIPNSNSEKNLMDGILYLICWNIKLEFPEIINELNPNGLMLDKLNIPTSIVDNEKELEELFNKMIPI